MGDPRLRNRLIAARAVMMAVIAQPCARSSGPKSGGGITGPGLIRGAERPAVGVSVSRAVTQAIVGCRS